MSSKEELQRAIAAYKAGHRREARTRLLAYVETNQQNELAWLMLSNLVYDPEDRIIALENALVLNPHNEKAAARLWKLKRQQYQGADKEHLPKNHKGYFLIVLDEIIERHYS